ncbi:hypothetical protein MPHLEI_24234 [Mycolicibacterium phlei RIVM601174]|jgi:lipoprotein LpqH|nr:hypothetical protein MPHLEI_24234 [Mycolicibacterium phlei RIVM601174]
MSNRTVLAIALSIAAALSACSTTAAPERAAGTLPSGTAEIALDGALVDTVHTVKCSTTEAVTTIEAGDENAGATITVDTSDKPVVRSAELRAVNGFTGSAWDGLGPGTDLEITGQTYVLKGAAAGFAEDNPSQRITRDFTIKVGC